MSRAQQRIRSMRDIKSGLGQVDSLTVAYKAYLRITCIEMERERKMLERDSAKRRIEAIDERMKEIDDEKNEILLAQGERSQEGESPEQTAQGEGRSSESEAPRPRRSRPVRGQAEGQSACGRNRSEGDGFHIRY